MNSIKFILIIIFLLFSPSLASAQWWNSSYSTMWNTPIPNGTRPYVINLTLHTGNGISNSTDVFADGGTNLVFYWNDAVGSGATINFNITVNNVTTVPFWIASIGDNNQTALLYILTPVNGSVQIWGNGANYTYNNTLGGINTFNLFDDFNGASVNTSLWDNGGTYPPVSSGLVYFQNADPTTQTIISKKTFNPTSNKIVARFELIPRSGGYASRLFLGYNNSADLNNPGGYVSPFHVDTGGSTVNRLYSYYSANFISYSWTDNIFYNISIVLDPTYHSIVNVSDGTTTTAGTALSASSNRVYLGGVGTNAKVDYVFVTNYSTPEPTWATWSEPVYLSPQINSWTNNYTSDTTLTFTKLTSSTPVNFSLDISRQSSQSWTVNGVDQAQNLPYFNYAFTQNGTFQINYTATNSSTGIYVYKNWTVTARNYTLELISPANTSTGISIPVTLSWREWPLSASYQYQVATDYQFINIVTSGMGTITPGNENITSIISGLSTSTTYYWRVKNTTSPYTNFFIFTTSAPVIVPGQFNITVFDEQNTSLRIMNFSTQLSNTTHTLPSKTTSTGWTNYSGDEVSSGQYLIIATPNSPYYQRMVLATSPANVTMYVPNSTSPNTINLVSFSLLDVTGFFPYQTSTITLLRGGLIMDKAYFSADGTHPVYLIQGNNYQIQIQNGNNLQSFANFVPLTSATSQIVINDFSPNTTQMNPFVYNMTYNTSKIILNWNDVGGVLSLLTFTVGQGTNYSNLVQICSLTTSVSHGQSICSINNNSIYNVSFSAKLTDGTYQNSSFYIDYTKGKRQDSSGTSTITGSPIGIGFKWNYGTFTMPDWVYTWVILIVIILLGGTFGTYHAGIGGIIILIMTLIFESVGLFRPFGSSDPDNLATMGITGGILIMVILYYLQHRDKGG